MEALTVVIPMIILIMCLRGILISQHSIKKLGEIKKSALSSLDERKDKALALIEEGKEWEHLYDSINLEDIFAPVSLKKLPMRIFQITKWTHNDFFWEE